MLGLGRWGSRAPFPPDHTELGVDALVLALKTLYDPSGADGLTARASSCGSASTSSRLA